MWWVVADYALEVMHEQERPNGQETGNVVNDVPGIGHMVSRDTTTCRRLTTKKFLSLEAMGTQLKNQSRCSIEVKTGW